MNRYDTRRSHSGSKTHLAETQTRALLCGSNAQTTRICSGTNGSLATCRKCREKAGLPVMPISEREKRTRASINRARKAAQ